MTDEFKSPLRVIGGAKGSHCFYPTQMDMSGKGCTGGCAYCLDGDTLITMHDLSVKPIREIKRGDNIIGVSNTKGYKKFIPSEVEEVWTTIKPMYKITLDNGIIVKCSGDHRWLTNRGWKYTINNESGIDRAHLTVNNSIMMLSEQVITADESEMYKRGYLSGAIKGDAHHDTHEVFNTVKNKYEILYQFNLRAMDIEMIGRVKNYLNNFGISTNWFMEDKLYGIRTSSQYNFYKIKDLIKFEDDTEFKRGFIAGLFDAEGSYSCGTLRFFNSDIDILKMLDSALCEFNIPFTYDVCHKPANKIVHVTRIIGGRSVHIKLFQVCNPAISRKRNIFGTTLLNKARVVSIEKVSESETLYDIQTSSENFIANGLVSHNCYARGLLEFRGNWNPHEPAVADVAKVRKLFEKAFDERKDTKDAKALRECSAIRIGGMTDPMLHNLDETIELLKLCDEYNKKYILFTKGSEIGTIPVLEAMRPDLAYIQITVVSMNREWHNKVEPYTSDWLARASSFYYLSDAGFNAAARIAPIVPDSPYFDLREVEALMKYEPSGVIAETLRLNSQMIKGFDQAGVDIRPYMTDMISSGSTKFYSVEKRKQVYESIKQVCDMYDMPFSVCETDHFEDFKYLWSNPNDCCNAPWSE
jgi:DNA repair photolyase